MLTALIAIGFIAIFFVLMSVRLIFIKDGQFKGTCASQNPFLNKEGASCGYCGRPAGSGECAKDANEVNKVLEKFS